MRKPKIRECFSHLLPGHGVNRPSQYSLLLLTQEGQRVIEITRSSTILLMVPTFLCLSDPRDTCTGASGWVSVGRVLIL